MQKIDEIQEKGGSINDHQSTPGGIFQIKLNKEQIMTPAVPGSRMFCIQTLYGLWNLFYVAARL